MAGHDFCDCVRPRRLLPARRNISPKTLFATTFSTHWVVVIVTLFLFVQASTVGSASPPRRWTPSRIAAGAEVRSSSIDPGVVKVGDNVTFTCLVYGEEIAFDAGGCLWNAPHPEPPVAPRLAQADSIIQPLGDSTDAHSCDFLITAVTAEHHGTWECNPVMRNNMGIHADKRKPLNLTVAVPPTPSRPVIPGQEESSSEISVESEERNFTCSLLATRGEPQFYWYIVSASGEQEEPLDVEAYQWSAPTENLEAAASMRDLHDFYSNITLAMEGDMNSNFLRCYVDHLALQGGENFTDVALFVQTPPKDRQCVESHGGHLGIVEDFDCAENAFNFLRGDEATISYLFSANPEPTSVQWTIPGRPITEGPLVGNSATNDGVFTARWGPAELSEVSMRSNMSMDWDRGDLYWANLTISTFRSRYEDERYVLEVSNGVEFDEQETVVTTPAPARMVNNRRPSAYNTRNQGNAGPVAVSPKHTVLRRFEFAVRALPGGVKEAGLGGGAIAGIVLGVLAVVIIIAVIIAARMKGLLCFRNSYAPGLNSYFRQSLSSWRKPRNTQNNQEYEGVATSAPREQSGVDEGPRGSSTTESVDTDEKPPPLPKKPRHMKQEDYRDTEGDDVV